MLGFACACKWNGIDTLSIVVLVSAVLLFGAKFSQNEQIVRYGRNLRQVGVFGSALCLLVVPIIAYAVTYWPLCRSLHRPFGVHELIAMNVYIWHFHRHVPGNPAIASKWYSWMLQVAPQRALSYLVGNWVVMWGGLVALAVCARRMAGSFAEMFVVLLYLGNLIQWAITPQTYLYYYYYFPSAMFLGVAIVLAIRRAPPRIFGVSPPLACVVAAACAFLFCFAHMAHLESPFDCALGCWP
jgi:dolichyl-phosphate-mannose-protein mannosyltransferase